MKQPAFCTKSFVTCSSSWTSRTVAAVLLFAYSLVTTAPNTPDARRVPAPRTIGPDAPMLERPLAMSPSGTTSVPELTVVLPVCVLRGFASVTMPPPVVPLFTTTSVSPVKRVVTLVSTPFPGSSVTVAADAICTAANIPAIPIIAVLFCFISRSSSSAQTADTAQA